MNAFDAQRLLLTNSFEDFVKWAWPLVSPDPLVWGQHLDALCEHLQAVRSGRVHNLLVNLPPRHSKSLLCSVLFPVWLWLADPTERIISASYSMKLSTEHALLSRRLLESQEFRGLFPHLELSNDTNSKAHYVNTAGGQRLAVSPGASTTGFNATLILVDDLHSVQERESEASREAAVAYYRTTLASRAVPGRRVATVVIGQRVHASDVSGYVLDTLDSSWTCLVLPMEFNPEVVRLPNALGWTDWRTQAGEVLWPDAFPADKVARIKRDHRHDYSVLYLQNPYDSAGDLFRAEWFRYYTETDGAFLLNGRAVRKGSCTRIAAVDLAVSTSSTADWTVCVVADLQGGDIIIRHVLRKRLDGTRLVPELRAFFDAWRPAFMAVERAGQQSVIIDQLRQAGVVVHTVTPTTDKEIRSIPAQAKMEAGQIWWPEHAPWVADFEAELLSFPRGRHDDCVDALSYLVMKAQRYDRSTPEPTDQELREKAAGERVGRFQKMLWAGVDL